MEKKIIHLKTVDSTNAYLRALGSQGAAEGTVVIADSQTAGRGRLGRSFFSPKSGLYMSILLRPKENASDALFITAAAAVAVCRAIEALCSQKCLIKWVNDIYCDGKKVCGILAEGALNPDTNRLSFVVLGVGVNITDPENGFPADISDRAASLFSNKKSPENFRDLLAEKITDEFFLIYNSFPDNSFMNEYRRRSFLIGQEISFYKDNECQTARVINIDEKGRLIVNQNDRLITIGTGEVTVRQKKNEK